MRSQQYSDRDEWLAARMGRITGSKLGSLIGKRDGKPKKGYWELIAEKVALPPTGENVMDRGNRLEDEAVQRFILETGKNVDTSLVIWSRDERRRYCHFTRWLCHNRGGRQDHNNRGR